MLAASIILAPLILTADDAIITGNAGILSDFIFREIPKDTGVGNGGIDFEYMDFYAGTWIADLGDGIEYDLYGGYVSTTGRIFTLVLATNLTAKMLVMKTPISALQNCNNS